MRGQGRENDPFVQWDLFHLTTQEQVLIENEPSENAMEAREETSLWGRRHSNHNSTEMVMAGGQGGKDRHKEQKHDSGKG